MFRPNSRSLILLTGGLLALGPLTLDMYIPALPGMTESLGTTASVVQLTVSVYLIGFALGQLVYGPLADRYGRRPAMMGGLVLFGLASVACLFAPNVETLIAARFFQALGVSAGQVMSRAIIRDQHEGSDISQMLAYSTVFIGATSATSPVLGSFLTVWLGWRVVFVIHVVVCAAFLLLIWRVFGETLRERDPLATRVGPMVRNVGRLLADRAFTAYMTSLCFMFGAALAFITGSSFVFVESFGLQTQNFGFVFTAIAGSFALGSLVAGRLARRIEGRTLFVRAAVAVALGGIALGAVALSGNAGVYSITAPFMVMTFAMGFTVSLGIAGALAPHAEMAGTASAVLGFTQGVASAVAGVLVGFLFDGTAVPMATTIAVLALGVPVSFLIIAPRRAH